MYENTQKRYKIEEHLITCSHNWQIKYRIPKLQTDKLLNFRPRHLLIQITKKVRT